MRDEITISKDGRGYRLFTRTALPQPLDVVFPFFADAKNLDELTPPFLNFRIVTPDPIEMKVGALIDYKLRMRGLPISWRTEITAWEPPHRFMDVQLRGPYRWWRHEHRFVSKGDKTIVEDEVSYGVPLGVLLHPLFIKRDLLNIFHYRLSRMHTLFDDAGR